MMHRRAFIHSSLAAGALAAMPLLAAEESQKPKLKKAVKFGMIGINAPIKEKFELIKELSSQGVEVDSPSAINRDEAVKAQEITGIKIHGVIDSVHWDDKHRLSHPNKSVQAAGLAALCGALVDAHLYGADDSPPPPLRKNCTKLGDWVTGPDAGADVMVGSTPRDWLSAGPVNSSGMPRVARVCAGPVPLAGPDLLEPIAAAQTPQKQRDRQREKQPDTVGPGIDRLSKT